MCSKLFSNLNIIHYLHLLINAGYREEVTLELGSKLISAKMGAIYVSFNKFEPLSAVLIKPLRRNRQETRQDGGDDDNSNRLYEDRNLLRHNSLSFRQSHSMQLHKS